jgi:hypothetical protein
MNASISLNLTALLAISPYLVADRLMADDPALLPFLTYTDRDSYLVWVTAWQVEYRTLSAAIRTEKVAWRAAGSNIPHPLQISLRNHRRLARTLLALRAAGKRDSWAKAQAARGPVLALQEA